MSKAEYEDDCLEVKYRSRFKDYISEGDGAALKNTNPVEEPINAEDEDEDDFNHMGPYDVADPVAQEPDDIDDDDFSSIWL